MNLIFKKPIEPDTIRTVTPDGMLAVKKNTSEYTEARYKEFSDWCFENQHEIIDRGDFYEAVPFVPPEPSIKEKEKQVRAERDVLLEQSDVYLLPDYPITEEDKKKVLAYRQELRDIPQKAEFPRGVVFPENPLKKPQDTTALQLPKIGI